jgi:RNA polymerase sigma-70 factor (ECF subfamily)
MTMTLTMSIRRLPRAVPEPLEGWVASAQAGDRDALEFFLEAIEQRVYTLAWRLLGDRALADDAAQESLLKICRNLDGYTLGTNLRAWIYRIVVNQVHDVRRSRGAVREVCPPEALAASDYDPARRQQLQRVMEALGVLTPKEREALVLIDIEGFSSKEAARALGCLAITARTRAAQARKKVRQQLIRYYPELKDLS